MLLLRLWGGRAAAALLAACALAQGLRPCGRNWATAIRPLPCRRETYAESRRPCTDPAWEDTGGLPAGSAIWPSPAFDFEHDEFWDLAAFAADHGWTSNSFYMGHMDGNLAAVTLAGEMNALSADTLYVFVDEDELARDSTSPCTTTGSNGILVGSVEPLALRGGTRPGGRRPCAMDLKRSAA